MGLYNSPTSEKNLLPSPLSEDRCIFCHQKMEPLDRYLPDRDSFDYKCSRCNPQVIISLSGSLTVDPRLESFGKNEMKRRHFMNAVSACARPEFVVTASVLNL